MQLGFVSEATLRDALSEKLGPAVGRPRAHHRRPGGAQAAAARAWRGATACSRWRSTAAERKFIVALADTNNIVAIDQLRAHLKGELEIELRLAGDSEIERAIEHYYGHEFSIDGILQRDRDRRGRLRHRRRGRRILASRWCA